jgi:hypothetical protein
MSSDVREVRVDIRHHMLAASAQLSEGDDGTVHLALEHPPPVRSVLSVHTDEGAHAFEVTRAVEVESEGVRPGVYGRFVGHEALDVLDKVGTEHLEAGEAASDHEDDPDHSGYLAMPAPVVDPDPSDRIDVDEVRRLEDTEAEAASETEQPTDDDDEAASGDASASSDADGDGEPAPGDSTRRGRRRRGRKRR